MGEVAAEDVPAATPILWGWPLTRKAGSTFCGCPTAKLRFLPSAGGASSASTPMVRDVVATGLSMPAAMAFVPDGALFVSP